MNKARRIEELEMENDMITKNAAELYNLLALAGAKQRDDGIWVWPYYRVVNKRPVCEWLETEEWKQRRKDAANAVAIAVGVLIDVS